MADAPEGDDKKKAEAIRNFGRAFGGAVPHNRALKLWLLDIEWAGVALMRLPYAEHLVGNPDTGVLHGGAITSLMDATCGAAIFIGMTPPRPIATLDLRIDYLHPAKPKLDVLCRARCTKITRNVAFVRATAFHEEDDPIAAAAGSFMIFGGKKSAAMKDLGGSHT